MSNFKMNGSSCVYFENGIPTISNGYWNDILDAQLLLKLCENIVLGKELKPYTMLFNGNDIGGLNPMYALFFDEEEEAVYVGSKDDAYVAVTQANAELIPNFDFQEEGTWNREAPFDALLSRWMLSIRPA